MEKPAAMDTAVSVTMSTDKTVCFSVVPKNAVWSLCDSYFSVRFLFDSCLVSYENLACDSKPDIICFQVTDSKKKKVALQAIPDVASLSTFKPWTSVIEAKARQQSNSCAIHSTVIVLLAKTMLHTYAPAMPIPEADMVDLISKSLVDGCLFKLAYCSYYDRIPTIFIDWAEACDSIALFQSAIEIHSRWSGRIVRTEDQQICEECTLFLALEDFIKHQRPHSWFILGFHGHWFNVFSHGQVLRLIDTLPFCLEPYGHAKYAATYEFTSPIRLVMFFNQLFPTDFDPQLKQRGVRFSAFEVTVRDSFHSNDYEGTNSSQIRD